MAVDPLYGYPAESLAAHVQIDYARMLAEMRRHATRFRYGYFPSLAAAEDSRRRAADRFLADYEAGFLQGRYRGASLPRLPFPMARSPSFSPPTCCSLCRAPRLCFHLAACRELMRVASGEVSVHPVCGLGGKPYPGLGRLREELGRRGIGSRVVPVDYRFFAGADTLLVLERGSGS